MRVTRLRRPAKEASAARRAVMLAAAGLLSAAACSAAPPREIGDYRIVETKSFGCQPRQEFYHLGPVGERAGPLYLGTCFTPRYIKTNFNVSGDASCFAVAASGAAIVYFHRPNVCGAGARAKSKPGGVYIHARDGGDRLLLADDVAGQVWTSRNVEAGSIFVSRRRKDPSAKYGICSENVFVSAEGIITPVAPSPDAPGCGGD